MKMQLMIPILTALSENFQDQCKKSENMFGDGHAAEKIIKHIKDKLKGTIDLEKQFYDIDS